MLVSSWFYDNWAQIWHRCKWWLAWYVFQKDNVEKWQHEAPEVVSFEHFPAESSPDVTHDESNASSPVTEDRNHVIAVAVATAAAAAQAAANVVRLAGYGRYSKEERAAILIQSYYRGYLVIPLFISL